MLLSWRDFQVARQARGWMIPIKKAVRKTQQNNCGKLRNTDDVQKFLNGLSMEFIMKMTTIEGVLEFCPREVSDKMAFLERCRIYLIRKKEDLDSQFMQMGHFEERLLTILQEYFSSHNPKQ